MDRMCEHVAADGGDAARVAGGAAEQGDAFQ